MTTIDQLQRDLEARKLAASRRKAAAQADAQAIVGFAKAQGRSHMTRGEDSRIDRLIGLRDRADRELAELDRGLAECAAEVADQAEFATRAFEIHDTGVQRPAYDRVARIGREARTYSPDADRAAGGQPGGAFLLDVGRSFMGDPLAADRLAAHQREELTERPSLSGMAQRAVNTGNFSGLVVPQYLVDLYAPAVAAMRPFADICAHHDLPPVGMTVNISRITTATSAALQTSENSAVSTTDIDDTLLTENVQTVAGSVIVSRQAIDRGLLTEEVTTGDLLKRYATALDSTLINQATTGLAGVSTSQSYVNATVDTSAIPAFWKQLIQAQNTVETTLLAQAQPSHFIMAPRRWNWTTAAVSASWPVIAGTNVPPQNWGLQLTNAYGPAVRAVAANGMKVTVDANISTVCLGTALTGGTQDQAYVLAADEFHLWESPDGAVLIRAEQPAAANLGILFVAFGYFAYSGRRYPGSSVVVNGTGLASPSFA
jgi:hypothetical protein